MSNCYASYYTRIPYYTEEQKAWLAKELITQENLNAALEKGGNDWDPFAEGEGEWNFGQDEFQIPERDDPDKEVLGYLCLQDCEANQADVAFLALIYNEIFHCLDKPGWTMHVAYTDDSGNEQSFGGCSYTIYNGRTHFISSWDYEDFIHEEQENETIVTTWQAAL